MIGRIRTTLAAAAVLAAVALGVPACTASPGSAQSSTAPIPSVASGFVTTDGSSFRLGGRPFRFVGVNIYDAAASDRYSCRAGTRMSDEQLRSTLRTLHDQAGATVLRFWAYQTYTQGATYWDGVDRVLAAARDAGMKAIPVLEDGPGDCTTTSVRVPKTLFGGDSWYTEGYKNPYGNATLSYREYARAVAEHYAGDPTILGWSMMNEAETNTRAADAAPALVGFAKDVAGVIRSVDPNHLITVGTQSNGAPGASGPDFAALYSLPEVSFAEVHDWGYWGSDTAAMPGGEGADPPAAASPECTARNAPIGCSFALARGLRKPLVVGEAGMVGRTEAERTRRARLLRTKMDAAFGAGADGYLIWSVTTTDTDGYDLVLSRNDPLIGQLHAVAEGLR